jgi:hypothetical protein
VERRVERAGKRQRRDKIGAEYAKGEALTLEPNDDRWLDIVLTTASEDTPDDEEDFDY